MKPARAPAPTPPRPPRCPTPPSRAWCRRSPSTSTRCSSARQPVSSSCPPAPTACSRAKATTAQCLPRAELLPADAEVGPTYAQTGFDTLWSGAGATFIAISLAFFCLTTLIAYYYMAETNLRFMLGKYSTTSMPVIRGTVGRTSP